MKKTIAAAIAALIVAYGLTGCATSEKVTTSSEIVEYSANVMVAAQAPARTRIEPLPTSYVLFPSYTRPVDTGDDMDLDEYYSKAGAAEAAHKARVVDYCIGHLRTFPLETQTTAADPYMNTIRMFVPVTNPLNISGDVMRLTIKEDKTLVTENVMSNDKLTPICEGFAANYDYLRADRMLAIFTEAGMAEVTKGPVFVLDLGTEEVILDRSDAEGSMTIQGLATVWRDEVYQAQNAAETKENALFDRRVQLKAEIAESRAKAKNKDFTKSVRKAAKSNYKQKEEELETVDKKLFARNSTERRVACFVAEGLETFGAKFFAGGVISSLMGDFCEAETEDS